MPELPEVEVVRAGLEDHLVGRTFSSIEILNLRAIRRHLPGPADFIALLNGRTVTAARRRGKYLWFGLDDGDAVIAHLGMSGQFRIAPAVDSPHLRVRFGFADGGPEVHFVDQRTFGGLAYSHGGASLPPEIATSRPTRWKRASTSMLLWPECALAERV